MAKKSVLAIQERPELDVYTTDSGFIGIKQTVRGEESIILLTPDEASTVANSLKTAIKQVQPTK